MVSQDGAIFVSRVGKHSEPEELHCECGYDAKAIAAAVRELVVDKYAATVALS